MTNKKNDDSWNIFRADLFSKIVFASIIGLFVFWGKTLYDQGRILQKLDNQDYKLKTLESEVVWIKTVMVTRIEILETVKRIEQNIENNNLKSQNSLKDFIIARKSK